jgi:hypothetical protein
MERPPSTTCSVFRRITAKLPGLACLPELLGTGKAGAGLVANRLQVLGKKMAECKVLHGWKKGETDDGTGVMVRACILNGALGGVTDAKLATKIANNYAGDPLSKDGYETRDQHLARIQHNAPSRTFSDTADATIVQLVDACNGGKKRWTKIALEFVQIQRAAARPTRTSYGRADSRPLPWFWIPISTILP